MSKPINHYKLVSTKVCLLYISMQRYILCSF